MKKTPLQAATEYANRTGDTYLIIENQSETTWVSERAFRVAPPELFKGYQIKQTIKPERK